MVDMALATSAAPTIYRPLESGGYRLIDGGAWANNPVMLAVVEAMIALIRSRGTSWASIGCGDEPYHVTRRMTWAMRAQSLAATNQARLLLGPASIVRIEPTPARPHGRRVGRHQQIELGMQVEDWPEGTAKFRIGVVGKPAHPDADT